MIWQDVGRLLAGLAIGALLALGLLECPSARLLLDESKQPAVPPESQLRLGQ